MDDKLEDPEIVEVRLQPLLGVSPTVYVPILYALGLAVVLFLILVLPGITANGTQLTVVSSPSGAAVRVDGNYAGATPGTFFVAAGERQIEVERPGFTAHRETLDVRGRLIGSRFLPRRRRVVVNLGFGDESAAAVRGGVDALVAAAAVEFASWALAGEASGQYQFPPIARDLAGDLRGVDPVSNAGVRDAFGRFTRIALPQVSSEAQLADLAAALLSVGGEAAPALPGGLVFAVQELARTAASAPLMPLHLEAVLTGSRAEAVRSTAWWQAASAQAAEPASAGELVGAQAGPTIATPFGLVFVPFEPPSGAFVIPSDGGARGGEYPLVASIAPFAFSRTEVPARLYLEFIADNPYWAAPNREQLVTDGVVDVDYLAEIDAMRASPSLPVTGISAYAADAFAEWLSGRLAAGSAVRLPTEAEWEYVLAVSRPTQGVFSASAGPSAVGDAFGSRTGVIGLIGNVWEFTSDPFARFSRVYPNSDVATAALDGLQRVVRGGGWATDGRRFIATDRGSLDPSWTSPFVGIRLVLVSDR